MATIQATASGPGDFRPLDVPALERMAAELRCDIIRMIHAAGEGHPGGSLSATDIVAALYFRIMNLDPEQPNWPDRDRFIMSKGHACPVWYSALAERGYLCDCDMTSLRCLNSIFQGHPDMNKTCGLDMSAGSLGQGLSAGIGMALAARVHKRNYRVWVMIGDGETQEGSIWEAAMSAAAFKIDTLTAVLDRNRIQNDDFIDNIMPIEPVVDKWRAFGWHVIEIDGHDMAQVVEALEKAPTVKGKPTLILANTVKGKGVSFMENNPVWHGRAPTLEEAQQALREIQTAAGLEVNDVIN